MTTGRFGYHVVQKSKTTPDPSSVIAALVQAGQPLRAVMWSVPRKTWIYAPAIAAGLLYDDQYQREVHPIDRATAEQIARDHLQTELPSEETLREMCEEGARLGQDWGPPRSSPSPA
jgi:hypothetical protein